LLSQDFRLIVFEHRFGVLERHAMLLAIGLRLLHVPLEFMVVSHRSLDRLFSHPSTVNGNCQDSLAGMSTTMRRYLDHALLREARE